VCDGAVEVKEPGPPFTSTVSPITFGSGDASRSNVVFALCRKSDASTS